MNKFFFINILIPTAIGTTDVCLRLYEIRDQLRPEVGTFALTPGFAGNATCDFHDMCGGLQRDGDPISCKDAFELLTWHNERPPLETPPIVMPPARYANAVSRDIGESLLDLDESRNSRDLGRMSPEMRGYLDQLQRVVGQILQRSMTMFPRIFYDEEIDGATFRDLVTITDRLKLSMNSGDRQQRLSVIKYIHRSRWMKLYAFQMASLVRYVAQLSLVDMEIAMISIAPTIHAYLYLCTHLDIDFFNSLDWHWVLPLLARYHPLYITEPSNLLWTVPTLPTNALPVSIQIGPDLDIDHFRDFVWNTDLRWNDLEFLADYFLSNITELVRLRGQLDAGEDVKEEVEEYAHRVQKLAYTLRFLPQETKFVPLALSPEFLRAVNAVVSARSGSDFRIDHFTMTTLLRLTRSHLSGDSIWTFIKPRVSIIPPSWGIQELNITYSPSGRPRISEIVKGILTLQVSRLRYERSFRWRNSTPSLQSKTETELYSDFLAVLIAEPSFGRNPEIPGQPFTARDLQLTGMELRTHMLYHRAVGRLIGVCLRDPTLRHLLAPFWITSSEPSTILEIIFFGSHMVRRGVYDMLPYGALEEMFLDANALVNRLTLL